MDDNYTITFNFYINECFKPIAFYPIADNGCCDKDFFILTANRDEHRPDGLNYSCQCGCGMWCTNGHDTEQAAVNEYRKMCEARNKRRKHK
jgi:hypothetical protein